MNWCMKSNNSTAPKGHDHLISVSDSSSKWNCSFPLKMMICQILSVVLQNCRLIRGRSSLSGVSPSAELVFQQQNRTEVRKLQGELEASLQEVQVVSSQAREQTEQLEHSRSVQQNLMAAQSHLDESYREAQGRLLDAEQRVREFQAEHAQGAIFDAVFVRFCEESHLTCSTYYNSSSESLLFADV